MLFFGFEFTGGQIGHGFSLLAMPAGAAIMGLNLTGSFVITFDTSRWYAETS
jgi:hypothetical protein